MIVAVQAGIMLHPAAELRNAASTTPYLAAGRCGLPRSLASGAALSPSTTWVPLSDRLAFHLDHRHPAGHTLFDSLNYDSAKSGQHQCHRMVPLLNVTPAAWWPLARGGADQGAAGPLRGGRLGRLVVAVEAGGGVDDPLGSTSQGFAGTTGEGAEAAEAEVAG